LQGDEGIVVITDGEIRASNRDEEVISCVRHALATSQPAVRVFAPDAPVRAAFLDLQEGGEGLLEADSPPEVRHILETALCRVRDIRAGTEEFAPAI
jgi:hypothetical protein